MVVFDASVLVDLFNAKLAGGRRLKIDLLVATLEKQKEKVVVPAPAYTEFLIGAGSARSDYQSRIEQSSVFRVEPYSKMVAMECAILLSDVLTSRESRSITKTKFKFDWMIVATAKALGSTCVYAGDKDIMNCCKRAGIRSIHLDDLPTPPVPPQISLPFEAPPG